MKPLSALTLICLFFPVIAEEENANLPGTGEESGFLETTYKPLSVWLDERFEVKFREMTPSLVFEQVPLNDIFYETANLPIDPVAFNFRSEDISRRELLLAIAEFWGLYMAFNYDDTGNPTAIIVEGPSLETPSLETPSPETR